MSDKREFTPFLFDSCSGASSKFKPASKAQAEEYAEKHCGLVLGGDIHSSLPDEMVNWDFPIHPEKIVRHGEVEH